MKQRKTTPATRAKMTSNLSPSATLRVNPVPLGHNRFKPPPVVKVASAADCHCMVGRRQDGRLGPWRTVDRRRLYGDLKRLRRTRRGTGLIIFTAAAILRRAVIQ